MTLVWTAQEILDATGGSFVGSVSMKESFGPVVFPTNYIRERSIVVHADALSWPPKQRQGSGQGHLSLDDLIDLSHERGAALVVAAETPTRPAALPILRVFNTYEALVMLARSARDRFHGRVVAVTGTAGKSSTRDLLADFLNEIGSTFASYGNWNSIPGIAMCLASLPRDSAFAVIEVGGGTLLSSHSPVLDLLKHHHAIITTIGINDTSRFPTPRATALTKSKLFRALPPTGRAYWPKDVAEADLLRSASSGCQRRIVGEANNATLTVEISGIKLDSTQIRISCQSYQAEVETQAVGAGLITNVALAAQCAHDLGVPASAVVRVLRSFRLQRRKMQIIEKRFADKLIVLIDDCHNATLASFHNLISHIRQIRNNSQRCIFILGRIAHIQGSENRIYKELAKLIQSAAPSAVILHDEGLDILAKYLNGHLPIFTTKNPSDTVELLKTLVSQNSLVVLKGSHRDTRMWEISKILRKRASSRVVTVKSQKYSNSPLRESENIINSAFFRPIVGDEERNSFLIGVLGDTYFGEYYASKMDVSRRFHPLHLNNYDFGFRSFSNFLKSNDLNIANLETALTAATVSPFGEARPYTHWARPDETLSCFRRHNIQVATLANNHVYDFGRAGVLETLAACNRLQVMTIGAGSDPVEARRPLRVECGASAGGGAAMRRREMLIFAGLAYRDVIRDRFEAYAEAGRPGCASLSDPLLFEAIKEARWRNRESLIVVIPHWQRDYQWASRRQRSFAFSALEAGADLVIGHGAHMLQQIERFGDGLAVHGLGNFVFNAPGRYRSSFAPPISAAVRLILPVDHAKAVKLRLYPILSDNRKTEYQPRFILGREVGQFLAMYVDLGLTPPDGRWSSDDDGYFLEFVLKSFTGTADDARSANISSETMLA